MKETLKQAYTAYLADAVEFKQGKEFYWRDKRQVFYSMYDATEFYTYTEEISQRRRCKQRIEKIVSILNDGKTTQQVSERMRKHADSMERALLGDMECLLT